MPVSHQRHHQNGKTQGKLIQEAAIVATINNAPLRKPNPNLSRRWHRGSSHLTRQEGRRRRESQNSLSTVVHGGKWLLALITS